MGSPLEKSSFSDLMKKQAKKRTMGGGGEQERGGGMYSFHA